MFVYAGMTSFFLDFVLKFKARGLSAIWPQLIGCGFLAMPMQIGNHRQYNRIEYQQNKDRCATNVLRAPEQSMVIGARVIG